jgi:hypothetical protein
MRVSVSPDCSLVVVLEVEMVGNTTARRCPLGDLVAKAQTMKGIGRQSQMPPEATIFDESMVVGLCGKMEREWKRRESVDGVRLYREVLHPVG